MPATDHDVATMLADIKLQRLGPADAGLAIASVPLPRDAEVDFSLAGSPTFTQPLGQWHGSGDKPAPRRLLMVGDTGGTAPANLELGRHNPAPADEPPTAEAVRFALSPDPMYVWERHLLRIHWKGQSFGIAMGMRVGSELRWWEHCRMTVLSETPWCREIEMGGSIPHVIYDAKTFYDNPGYRHPGLHTHHWLTGTIYARLHANGVCEIYARHLNGRSFDDGLPLADAVPVVGLQFDQGRQEPETFCGTWDGSRTELAGGKVRLDASEAARLATPDRPGQIDRVAADDAGGFEGLAWQPYMGVELFSGLCTMDLKDDPWIFRAEDKIIPRGMCRTLRMSLSLNPERSPRVARYVAPAWWYGLCEEYSPAALLPVHDSYDEALESSHQWALEHTVDRGFEDGNVARGGKLFDCGRNEPGWEGEMPAALLLHAYRSGAAADYEHAMRAAYFFTDVAIDHAAKMVRMHGYPPNGFSVPMNRVLGTVYGYLETGDQFLLDAAEAVTEAGFRAHRNSWPRLAVGRDACFVRGAMLLYRYFDNRHFLRIAQQGIRDTIASQNPDGSFGDQGGGAGVHGWGAYIVKPWMGCMATNGMVDYLEVLPDGMPEAWQSVKRFADWLLANRVPVKRTERGETDTPTFSGWSYMHNYNGGHRFVHHHQKLEVTIPSEGAWHHDYFARLLPFCSLRTGDPAYFNAFAESFEGYGPARHGDHSVIQSLFFLPWLQQHLWNARLDEGELVTAPAKFGPGTPTRGVVMTPAGDVAVEA